MPLTLILLSSALAAAPRPAWPAQEPVAWPIPEDAAPWAHHRLTLKLQDDLGARADGQGGLRFAQAVDRGALDALVAKEGLSFTQLLSSSDEDIESLEARARARSGVEPADLRAMMLVSVPGERPEDLERIGRALQALPLVEWAWIETVGLPPPGDISPTTSDYTSRQTYAGPDPGIDAEFVWSLGLTGTNVQLSDVEYGWIDTHEDLVDRDLHLESGTQISQTVRDYGWDEHGTAVLGETSSVDNAYGCTGLAHGAEVYTWPEYTDQLGSRRATAITNAAAASAAGDVILLEMQANGQSGYGPAELDASVWTASATAVAAGVVVVGAAGNGSQDLDATWYSNNYLSRGDSGAILVGAGSASVNHTPLSFTTYGSRVDVQGWGTAVFSLGYGDFASYGGDQNQYYTSAFGGTSSASPIVASAAVLVQDFAIAYSGGPITPEGLRELLIDTGTPQGGTNHIGPLPDLAAALAALDDDGDGGMDAAYGGDDCDDSEPTVYAGAPELADGLDNDCDGITEDTDTDGDGLADLSEEALGTDPENPDSDGDGLLDGEEVVLGTDPTSDDSDGDGLSDPDELELGTDPTEADSDGDGLNDGEELELGTDPLDEDSDGDGLSDGDELNQHGTDPLSADTDGDSLSDYDELFVHGTDPTDDDTDTDGLHDDEELALGTDPNLRDTDRDGVRDSDELDAGTDPLSADTDGDGLSDGEEAEAGSDPLNTDTDGDGLSDGEEVAIGSDPTVADSDGDGLSDGEEVEIGTDPLDEDTDADGFIDSEDADPLDPRWRKSRCSTVPAETAGSAWALLALVALGRRRRR
ncbi:MAG: S8 family serine peptidase [Alphaproteobacteria bacterium]|nr:S8 family serine peptidase [Alphaproteobacteria bacterium]